MRQPVKYRLRAGAGLPAAPHCHGLHASAACVRTPYLLAPSGERLTSAQWADYRTACATSRHHRRCSSVRSPADVARRHHGGQSTGQHRSQAQDAVLCDRRLCQLPNAAAPSLRIEVLPLHPRPLRGTPLRVALLGVARLPTLLYPVDRIRRDSPLDIGIEKFIAPLFGKIISNRRIAGRL